MATILVVEDDRSLQETLVYNLKRLEYTVEAVSDGQAAVEAARRLYPDLDLILLDLMLPKMDGFDVCKTLRQEMNTPILMLTARDDEIDRVLGLEIGADDYISKPFSMRELMARVKAHLRRDRLIREEIVSESSLNRTEVMSFGNLTVDLGRHELLLDGKPISIKPKELELLIYMARHQRKALSRETLLENVWGWEYVGNTRTVDVHIRWLREKIEQDPANPTRIITVRGSGYRFEG